jgi:[citrate (pro-3S)-lyase] ligase
MNTFSGIELRHIDLSVPRLRKEWEAFLQLHQLTPTAADTVVGLYDASDTLVGCASLCRGVIQCVAVDDALQGEGLTNSLISYLRELASQQGVDDLMIFTKPEYRSTFESLAFTTIATAPHAVLLESNPRGLKRYLDYLRLLTNDIDTTHVGVVVMNVNPFTLGHQHLIELAASMVSHLFVIPVGNDDRTLFPYRLRKRMLSRGVSHLYNVSICEASPYAVSQATFPSYFIKEADRLTDTHITLDLDIFTCHIAPALGATVRFAGTEPTDKVTARYNELMAQLLPKHGIEFHEIPRRKNGDDVISASRVRSNLARHHVAEALRDLPCENWHLILSWLACRALRIELDTTPKPGLVDMHDNGSHKDMDHALMCRSIEALFPYMAELAQHGLKEETPSHEEIVRIGLAGEKAMLAATDDVNTHKGALFAMGLTVTAAGVLLRHGTPLTTSNLSKQIATLAQLFLPGKGTHGADVRQRYGITSALDEAKSGYRRLFEEWLPYYRSINAADQLARQRMLLKIMTSLEDTNIYYRCGGDTAKAVKAEAEEALGKLSHEHLRAMNDSFIQRNISPGGAADMLALTILMDSLTLEDPL